MNTQKETPPAATEGAEDSFAGEQVQDRGDVDIVHHSEPAPFKRPPGLVGEIADYIYGSADRQMLEAAVLAALGLMAGIAGRTYNINGDGLNLYLLLLAQTGRGKSAMQRGIDRLVSEVRSKGVPAVEDFIGPDTFASGTAVVNRMSENPCFLSVFGEFGLKLKALSDPRANVHEAEQLRVLLDLYNRSGQANYLRSRAYADKDKTTRAVRSPAFSILAESTPDTVYSNLSYADIQSGLLPRFLVLECKSERPPRNLAAGGEPPDSLVLSLANLVEIAAKSRQETNGKPTCINVDIDEAAGDFLASIDADLDNIYNSGESPIERDLWNRALQNIHRVAALLAVGLNPHRPVITEECARWATDFVYGCVEGLLANFEGGFIGTGESRQEAELKRYVIEYVRMRPQKRQYSYNVPKAIAEEEGLVTVGYLRRRAKSCTAFTQDRRGFNGALNATLAAMVQTGALMKVPSGTVFNKYGLRGDVYGISNVREFI